MPHTIRYSFAAIMALLHDTIIILGIFALSISLSNPFYNLVVKKNLRLKVFFEILLRILLFFVSITIIFLGLYFESIS